ncbi:hypothetical protein [Saccharibacillus sp. JS10]|nr:hypothetical protein [Saccharibacillus sp. JS10]
MSTFKKMLVMPIPALAGSLQTFSKLHIDEASVRHLSTCALRTV